MTDITERIADAVRKAAFYTDPNGKRVFGYATSRVVVGDDPYISGLPNIVAAAVVEELRFTKEWTCGWDEQRDNAHPRTRYVTDWIDDD